MIATSEQFNVTETAARTVAENIAFSPGVRAQRFHNKQTGDTQRVFTGHQLIRDFTSVAAADGKPGFYICNYVQGGYAVIAADRHLQPIVMFAEHGTLPTADLRNIQVLPEGLITWLDNTSRITVILRQYPNEKNWLPGAKAGWKALGETAAEGSSGVSSRPLPDPEPEPCTSTQQGPLLQTTWGQGCGYNADVTTTSSRGDYCYRCPTGCVATAMAQVMNYWHYPAASFNWAAMLNNSGTPATAYLMKECGLAVNTDYHENASSADDDYIDDKLKGQYGYSSATYISSQAPGLFQDIVSNLSYGWPVVLGGYARAGLFGWYGTGDAHCWVTDGYIQSYCDGYGYLSYHMNWGWYGRYNCWCAYNNWQYTDDEGNTHSYNYVTSVTLNIHP